jgi:hypothetical protein
MRNASLLLVLLTLLSLEIRAADPSAKSAVPESCPVTVESEPRFVPRGSNDVAGDAFWHGNGRLAVYLNPAARLFVHNKRQKMVWYRDRDALHDGNWTAPLAISGHRFNSSDDDEAPYTEGPSPSLFENGFAIIGNIIVFPTKGCWQVSGNYEADYLSFVVWVD